ncbi:hypothetical protein [Flavobacterium sp.]|uniref:hypothetical protein n=1 Tax=Flavobacterium sp. TaxID=239 RepID=UPI0040475145
MNFIEEVIDITVVSGTTGTVEPNVATDKDDSTVVGCVIYCDDLSANPAMINASIQVGGQDVSKPQNIQNYRSREAGYDKGFKPVKPFTSGKPVRFEIRSIAEFTDTFRAQLILIKVPNNPSC